MRYSKVLAKLKRVDYKLLWKVHTLLYISKWYIEYRELKDIVAWVNREDLKSSETSSEQLKFARKIARYTNYVSRFVFFKSKCYDKALTVKQILNQNNISSELLMGVKTSNEKGMEAHAWIKCNDIPIIGGQVAKDYTPIRSFF